MRYGVISDIHANLLALNAVLAAFDNLGVDRVLCAGDIVGYGVQPNECIERLIELDAAVVAGNHDLVGAGRLRDEGPVFVQHSTAWTRRTLGPDGLAYLAELPLRVSIPGITLAHGSLHDPLEYVTTAQQAATQMGQLADLNPRTPVLILGHTHQAMAYTGGRILTPARSGIHLLPGRLPGRVRKARYAVVGPGR